MGISVGITLTSLLASEKTVSVEAEVKEKRWWLKGSIPVEVATEVIKFLHNMTKVIHNNTIIIGTSCKGIVNQNLRIFRLTYLYLKYTHI